MLMRVALTQRQSCCRHKDRPRSLFQPWAAIFQVIAVYNHSPPSNPAVAAIGALPLVMQPRYLPALQSHIPHSNGQV